MAAFAYLRTGGFGDPGIDLLLWGSAAAAVCAVVLPNRCSIGGDVFALVYDANTRKVTAYNGSGAAPLEIDQLAFVHRGFGERGARLATVPGCVAAWSDMLADGGRLGLDRALAPAIAYATEGFPVSHVLSAAIAPDAHRLSAPEGAARTYSPPGREAPPGEMLPPAPL